MYEYITPLESWSLTQDLNKNLCWVVSPVSYYKVGPYVGSKDRMLVKVYYSLCRR